MLPHLRETLLFLALAGILIPLLQRLRINQVLGFLAAGVLVGPFGVGLWAAEMPSLHYLSFISVETVAPLAELGVLLLMFMIGLDLSTERLWALRRWVFGAGTAQVAISAIIIGAIAYLFGNKLEAAVILGLVLALSSTAIVMQLLTENRSLGSPLGRASFSVLMLQDLAVVPIFILIGVFTTRDSGNLFVLVGVALAKSVAAIVLIYFAGRRLIRPLFSSFAKARQPDVFMAITLLSTLGIAAATAAAGLSMALGAFLAGLLLAETEFRHEVEVTIEPFKGLLMGMFFMSVGMQTDLREVVNSPVWIPLSVIGLFAIKTAVLAAVFRAGGFHWGRAIEGGLLMGQGGEFAFVAIGYALASTLLAPAVGQFVMLVVGLSMFATPLAARAGRIFSAWWERRHGTMDSALAALRPEPTDSQVIIAGFGRVGQLLAEILVQHGISYVAIENDAHLVLDLHPRGHTVYFGDAARVDMLRKVGAANAAAIVLTMDDPQAAMHAVQTIRREYPDTPLFARAQDEHDARDLKNAGAHLVIPETLESGLQLSALVLQTFGLADGTVTQLIQDARERRIALLQPDQSR